MTARDIVYGRRGGAWANEARATELLRDIRRAREAAGDTWPTIDPFQLRRPTTDEEWEGRARMAAARRPADRTIVDIEALDRTHRSAA